MPVRLVALGLEKVSLANQVGLSLLLPCHSQECVGLCVARGGGGGVGEGGHLLCKACYFSEEMESGDPLFSKLLSPP